MANAEKLGPQKSSNTRLGLKLTAYYGFSAWNEQMWSFATAIAFGHLGGNMQLAAAASFAASLAILLMGPSIGKWIDKSNRLKAVLATLLFTKISAAVTTAMLAAVLIVDHGHAKAWGSTISIALLSVCIVTNTVAILGNAAAKIILTKDWIVQICNTDRNRLTAFNTMLLRVRLVATFLSPYVAGELIVHTSIAISCFVTSGLSILLFVCEYRLLHSVYHSVDELSEKTVSKRSCVSVPPADTKPKTGHNVFSKVWRIARKVVKQFGKGWRLYFQQRAFMAGISLSLIYLTVLGFDSITDVYAFSQGLQANNIAIAKGIGAVIGIVAASAYPLMRSRLGLVKTGMLALGLETAGLVLPLASIWLPGSPFDPIGYYNQVNSSFVIDFMEASNETMAELFNGAAGNHKQISVIVFLAGIVISRFGMWTADLAINQIFQETVPADKRGMVNSVQNALNFLADLMKDIAVMGLPDPKTFGILIIGSWVAMFIGCLSYLVFMKRGLGEEGETKNLNPQKGEVSLYINTPVSPRRESIIGDIYARRHSKIIEEPSITEEQSDSAHP